LSFLKESDDVKKNKFWETMKGIIKLDPTEENLKKELNLRRDSFYSNWNAANVDPDDLRKHKEFLDR
jgi:hypothetical protein